MDSSGCPAGTGACMGGERNRGTSREQREGNAVKTQGGREWGGEKGTRSAKRGQMRVAKD